jgi:hypothetical protein
MGSNISHKRNMKANKFYILQNFKIKPVRRDKESRYISIKRTIHQEETTKDW